MAHAAFPAYTDLSVAVAELRTSDEALAPLPAWLHAIQQLGESMGGTPTHLARFVHVWHTLYSAILLLDHLQDHDELGASWLAALPDALQYQIALGAYAVAQHDLNDLANLIEPERAIRLRALWASAVLELAVGQYRDLSLAFHVSEDAQSAPLDVYETIAAQKTGAAFGLALGGAVALATAEPDQIDAATNAGVVFGMLLQYVDDLRDGEAQARHAGVFTLVLALAAQDGEGEQAIAPMTAWTLIYAQYDQALETILAPLPEPGHAVIQHLVRSTFGAVPALPSRASATQPWIAPET